MDLKELLKKFYDAGIMAEATLEEKYSFEQTLADNSEALQLQQTGVSSCSPFIKQVFYVLFNKENKDFFHSKTATHTFPAPLLLDAMIFKNKELATKYNSENKLKDFTVIKVIPQYSFE